MLTRSMFNVGSSTVLLLATTAIASADDLVLWNRLGSTSEILNSVIGPDLEFYTGGDDLSVIATPAYVPGFFGGALSIGPGAYNAFDRVHNVVLNNADQVLNSERGTIEAWYQQVSDPVPFQNGIYRIFDGGFGLASGVGLESHDGYLRFNVTFGGSFVEVLADISPRNGSWLHIAGVWDRSGIDGSSDALRLYVDGAVAAVTSTNNWGTTVGTRADIAGANDFDIVGKFYVDELKVYDYAVTDFVVPEPRSAMLAVVGMVVIGQIFRLRKE